MDKSQRLIYDEEGETLITNQIQDAYSSGVVDNYLTSQQPRNTKDTASDEKR